jgi:hypothetical protein
MMCRTFHVVPVVLFLRLVLPGPCTVWAQEPNQPCARECEAKAVDVMLNRIERLIAALDKSLTVMKNNVELEKDRSKATSYRRQSAQDLKQQLQVLITSKTDEIADELVRTVRADKPNDMVGISYLLSRGQ